MQLFYREYGDGPPMIILHGLLGSSDNWFTQARHFEKDYHVYLIDQRNHGQSPHSDDMDYAALADDLSEFIKAHDLINPVIIGHSMGGKTAMKFSLANPDLVKALIVVDIGPKAYPVQHQNIINAMKAVPLEKIKSRTDAESLISSALPDAAVRQFVLKNLTRHEDGRYIWRVNLDAVDRNLSKVGDLVKGQPFFGPTLFIRGGRSPYITDKDWPAIISLYPNAQLVTLDTGHWVQAEKPDDFAASVLAFLATIPSTS